MSRKLDQSEQDFFATFMGEKSMHKAAVDLDAQTIEALGIPAVSPSSLDQLEASAAQAAGTESPNSPPDSPAPPAAAAAAPPTEPAEPPAEETTQDEAPAAEPVEVGGFDHADAPPDEGDEEEFPPLPPVPTRGTHGRLFSDKRAHPMQILATLHDKYGVAWADWESDTLWWAIRRDFGPVGDVTRNKILALRLAISTDVPWLDWDVFEACGNAWNDIVPTFGSWQPLTPMQIAFTVRILQGIRSDEQFDNEVKAYIAAILDERGWAFAPPEYFDGAQDLLDRKAWMVGTKQQVAQAWEKIQDVDPSAIEWDHNSGLDVHLLKLMTVKHYVEGRDALMAQPAGRATGASTAQPPVP